MGFACEGVEDPHLNACPLQYELSAGCSAAKSRMTQAGVEIHGVLHGR